MPVSLGIHNGHHAACAVVRDGVLVAAIEQERMTRRKADGYEGLSGRLPIHECLAVAGLTLAEVDVIVSSFQAVGPGGAGLRRPLVEPGFERFDPHDPRHRVISHHQAHALSALGSSGFRGAAIVVCDLAGSTTKDGLDFACSFGEFERSVTSLDHAAETRTDVPVDLRGLRAGPAAAPARVLHSAQLPAYLRVRRREPLRQRLAPGIRPRERARRAHGPRVARRAGHDQHDQRQGCSGERDGSGEPTHRPKVAQDGAAAGWAWKFFHPRQEGEAGIHRRRAGVCAGRMVAQSRTARRSKTRSRCSMLASACRPTRQCHGIDEISE
ncbi:MAG: hypothetical protein HC927_07430 [Deltaproteobacteria bacterium]|nr:hypothetical protein [Deltaproteobacteria bacterium]